MTWDASRACPKPPRSVKQPKPSFGKGQRAKRTGGHAFPGNVSESRRAFIRKQRCIATRVRTGEWVLAQSWMPGTLKAMTPYKARIVSAHVKPGRGAGGPDAGNMVPLEWFVHDLVGQKGWAWLEKACRLMPAAEIAERFENLYLARAAAIAKNVKRKRS